MVTEILVNKWWTRESIHLETGEHYLAGTVLDSNYLGHRSVFHAGCVFARGLFRGQGTMEAMGGLPAPHIPR